MKHKICLNQILRFNSYPTINALCLHYKDQELLLHGKIIIVYCENHTKQTHTLQGQNAELLILMEPIYKYCNKCAFTGSKSLLLGFHSPRIQHYATAHSDPIVSSAFTFRVQYFLRCTDSWRQRLGFNYPTMQHHIADSESSAKTTVKTSTFALLLFTDTATYLN